MSITRRNFIKAAGATAALAYLPRTVGAATTDFDVVVVGGGFAGATVAKYIRMWSGYELSVALVDANPDHTSCVLSNLVLNGRMQLSELKLPLSRLATNHGVAIFVGTAASISPGQVDPTTGRSLTLGQVTLAEGRTTLQCKRMVLATGISFTQIPGWNPEEIPHAWIAGPQTTLLRKQLLTLRKGDTFVMTIPKAPYRCPPGPYERACVVADMLKRLNGGKVIIVDENTDIVAEKHTFRTAFNTIYKDIIDYKTNTRIDKVIFDSSRNLRAVVTTLGETIPGKVVNVIAPHRAPALLTDPILGLADGVGWVPVDPLTYETTQRAGSGIHVIGDSCTAPEQPKSGHMANSQAKVCADAIVRYLSGLNPLHDLERTRNITTNSACYSPITYSEASWLTANYRYDLTSKKMVLATPAPGEAPKWDGENFEDMFTWASNLFTDSFT